MPSEQDSTRTAQEGGRSMIWTVLGTVVVLSLMMGLLVGMGAFMDWQEEGWGQHSCEQKYGESAEYVGETSAFGGSGICEVDGEQKFVEVEYGGLLPPGDSNE